MKPKRFAPTGADDGFLNLSMAGASVVNLRCEQVAVRDGDALLAVCGAKGFTVTRPAQVRFIGLRLPLRALSPLVPDLDHSEVRVIPHSTAALKL